MDPDLREAWADLGQENKPTSTPNMPSRGVRVAGVHFGTIALHSSEHWVNLIPGGRGWQVVGFIDHRRTGLQPARLVWTREERWVDERVADKLPAHETEWLPYELDEAVGEAIAAKTEDMKTAAELASV